MKWTSKEPFYFDDNQYRERAKNMSPDALWARECLKYRKKVSSGCGVAFSSLMVVPTLGGSTLGLWASGRTLDVARRKERIITEEVARRNLPHYEKKKRDVLIPLGVSVAIISSIGILDVIFLTGTSSAVLNGAAPHGLTAATSAIDHPAQFFAGTWHGFEFQAQQFFHVGPQHLAMGVDNFHPTIGADGVHSIHQSVLQQPSHGLAQLGIAKAQAANGLHHNLAESGSLHAMRTAAADQFIANAASHSHAGAAGLAGAHLGMRLAEIGEQQAAQVFIADTGLPGAKTSIQIDDPTIKGSDSTAAQGLTADEIAKKLHAQALTGKTQKLFIFLSKAGRQPISQRIIADPSSKSCQHDSDDKAMKKCYFCKADINAETQPYYHCCMCSSPDFDICEICVAGRGCSCSNRAEHVLYRKGFLSSTVDYGQLEQAEVKQFKTRGEKGEDTATIDDV
jgi:hypothetical protein